MSEKVFLIDAAEVEATRVKLAELQKRAAKKGLVGGWSIQSIERVESKSEYGVTQVYYKTTLVGAPFALSGWSFIASVRWLEGQAFVSTLPGYEGESIDRAALVPNWCEECKTARARSAIFLVEKDGQRVQVGSSCLKDYLGASVTPAFLASLSEFGDGLGGLGSPAPEVATVSALAVAVKAARVFGFLSKAQAEARGGQSTAGVVSDYLWGSGAPAIEVRRAIGAVTPADEAAAKRVIEWVATEFTGSGDYAANLRVAASLEVTTARTLGILVSAVGAFQRAEEAAAAKASSTIAEEPFAAAGEKVEVEVEVASVRWFDSAYGPCCFYTFKSETHRFKWKTAAVDLEAGQKVTLSGTVKGVDTYEGAVFTVLTRCKVAVLV